MKTKRITIQKAAKLLAQRGYTLGSGSTDLIKKQTSYQVTFPNNTVRTLTVVEICDLI